MKFSKIEADYSEYLGPDYRSQDDVPAPILICNHVSTIDHFILIMNYFPRFIAKIGIKNYPILGTFADVMNCLFVERVGENAKNSKT